MSLMTANFASGTVWTGDNLDIMRGMNSECVDLIYLDPPFNSNRTYEAPIARQAWAAGSDECRCNRNFHGMRLMEMHRLKETGSIYLHCGPQAIISNSDGWGIRAC